jgi:hypothetical protein
VHAESKACSLSHVKRVSMACVVSESWLAREFGLVFESSM